MHVFSVCKDARVKQSMIASSKISLSESGIRRIDNHKNYTQSQCAQYSTIKKQRAQWLSIRRMRAIFEMAIMLV